MPEFLTLVPPLEALRTLLDNLPARVKVEGVETVSALGRVTAEAVLAPHSLPSFPRSTVDGYAVRAQDTHGASDSLPAYLKVEGEVPMGGVPDFGLEAGLCGLIHTGGMLPEGADAVVMVEYTQKSREGEVEVLRAIAAGENVLQTGEDVREGEEVIPLGTRLGPAEVGGLMALGITEIKVARRPVVGILSSGDEVVPPDKEIAPGQVRDVNSYSLSALVEEKGGIPRTYGIVPDKAEAMREAAAKALGECDALVITAGSSASARDLTAEVVNSLGAPGVLVHGVNVRPGKPTILAVCNGKAVIGLPGNPVSALVIARIFVSAVIERLLGLSKTLIQACVPARLSLNVSSQTGREDWVPVKLEREEDGYGAEPVFGKSNLIFTLVRADGLVRVPPEANGLESGAEVLVYLV